MFKDFGPTTESRRGARLPQLWFPFLVLVVSLVSTFVLWRIIDRGIVDRAESLFQTRAEEITNSIVKRLHDQEQVLLGANALFHVKGDAVSRHDWRRYVAALKLSENHPGILGVGYSAWLSPAQKEAHVRATRAEGFPTYRIHPEGHRPAYTSIVWLEPFDWRNQRAFGYDMYAEPVRRKAMDRACDTGLTSIAARIVLVQETDEDQQSGMLMYLPSYRRGLATDSPAGRRAALRGFVYSPIRMNDFVASTLSRMPADLDFEIHAGTPLSADNLMFSSQRVENRALPAGYRPKFSTVRQVEAFGVSWQFTFSSLPAFDKALDQGKSLATLLTGILSSILLSALAALQAHSRRQALTIAEQMHAAKQAAEEARAAAEQASLAKSEFLANMSHEIRTPMTVFMSAVEQLQFIDKDPEHQPLLDLADQASRRLYTLVSEILDFSKIEARRVEIEETWFNLRDCLQESMAMMAARAGEKGLCLELQIGPGIPEDIVGDQYRLGQVLLNLIGNAVKFTETGGVGIAVERHGALLEFSVSDTGIGIPEDKLQTVFETFSQVDSSSTRRYGGTGLGLAISKGLVELMGGEIRVRSQLAQGSVFSFTLPLKTLPQPEGAPAGEEAGASQTVPEAHILLAEDNPMVREVLLVTLGHRPWQTTTAQTGREAVHKWQSGRFDLVLMDLQMPEMDGLEAAREIRRQEAGQERKTAIIGLTAHADLAIQQECLAVGMDEVLVKPFEAVRLYAAIERCLGR
ncbi:MAG: response regulator [Deltaproteobacteria bacterium]|nr:MAG: response regulator [Deltaproteobacteria bacterium]